MAVRSQVLHTRIFDWLRIPAEDHGLRRNRIGSGGMQQSIKHRNFNELECHLPQSKLSGNGETSRIDCFWDAHGRLENPDVTCGRAYGVIRNTCQSRDPDPRRHLRYFFTKIGLKSATLKPDHNLTNSAGMQIFVFARSVEEREFARSLGAAWAGDFADVPPDRMDAIINTTPVWNPVVESLGHLRPRGRLVINAIRKEDADKNALLNLDYATHLWMEKEIKSVAKVMRMG